MCVSWTKFGPDWGRNVARGWGQIYTMNILFVGGKASRETQCSFEGLVFLASHVSCTRKSHCAKCQYPIRQWHNLRAFFSTQTAHSASIGFVFNYFLSLFFPSNCASLWFFRSRKKSSDYIFCLVSFKRKHRHNANQAKKKKKTQCIACENDIETHTWLSSGQNVWFFFGSSTVFWPG